jgi:hypothetical protein
MNAIKEITDEANRRVEKKYRLLGNDSIKEWQVKLICEVIWDRLMEVTKDAKKRKAKL